MLPSLYQKKNNVSIREFNVPESETIQQEIPSVYGGYGNAAIRRQQYTSAENSLDRARIRSNSNDSRVK